MRSVKLLHLSFFLIYFYAFLMRAAAFGQTLRRYGAGSYTADVLLEYRFKCRVGVLLHVSVKADKSSFNKEDNTFLILLFLSPDMIPRRLAV